MGVTSMCAAAAAPEPGHEEYGVQAQQHAKHDMCHAFKELAIAKAAASFVIQVVTYKATTVPSLPSRVL